MDAQWALPAVVEPVAPHIGERLKPEETDAYIRDKSKSEIAAAAVCTTMAQLAGLTGARAASNDWRAQDP